MAVYSDRQWRSYDLYALTNYLADKKRYISLTTLIKHFRKEDDLLSYPLVGSFVRYLVETFGMESVLKLWKERIGLEKMTGKTVEQLEVEWLNKCKETRSTRVIKY